MAWQELKSFQFTCDICKKVAVVRDVLWHSLPEGWGYKHPENSHSMFETSKDLCKECLNAG